MLVLVCLAISYLYLFHFIVLSNPDFSCSKNLLSSCVERVTTGTYNFASPILNVAFVGAFISGIAGLALGSAACATIPVRTQISDHVKIRFISQLINGISKVLQKLLKCFNGTMISQFFF